MLRRRRAARGALGQGARERPRGPAPGLVSQAWMRCSTARAACAPSSTSRGTACARVPGPDKTTHTHSCCAACANTHPLASTVRGAAPAWCQQAVRRTIEPSRSASQDTIHSFLLDIESLLDDCFMELRASESCEAMRAALDQIMLGGLARLEGPSPPHCGSPRRAHRLGVELGRQPRRGGVRGPYSATPSLPTRGLYLPSRGGAHTETRRIGRSARATAEPRQSPIASLRTGLGCWGEGTRPR